MGGRRVRHRNARRESPCRLSMLGGVNVMLVRLRGRVVARMRLGRGVVTIVVAAASMRLLWGSGVRVSM